MINFVPNIVGAVVGATVGPIFTTAAKYAKNLWYHKRNVQSLQNKLVQLKDAKEQVQHSVDAAKRNGDEIEPIVTNWLTAADDKIAELVQVGEKAKKKGFIGPCPKIWAWCTIGNKAEEEVKAVAELIQQRSNFQKVSFREAPQLAYGKGFQAFQSRTEVFNGIMKALKDDGIRSIGVHGMGGVGKTILVKEVARQVMEAKLFDTVVIATVTQSLDIEKIQNQIADLVGLRFDEQSMDGRALRLKHRLKKEKKILVVLDDIWERLDLQQVGIPFGDEHMGCKILLTSRHLNVLSNWMETQKNFHLGILTQEEAWDFFKKMGGDCVDRNDLQPTAIEVANKCAGLPIAIATIARALRNQSLNHWKEALRQLKSPASRDHQEVTEAVHSAIELSYSYLKSDEYKITFLLCGLLGHNSLIEDLLRYALGWGLLGDFDTIEEARNRVSVVVDNLKASCLLLDSYNSERFDIHDVVWDVAISIASRDRHMLVIREGEPLNKWPTKETMNHCTAISLRHPHVMIDQLPSKMEGSRLSIFCMEKDGPSIIPPEFFRGSKRLKVLDLGRMYFSSLPVSIGVLTNLHTLCLKGCAADDISIVGKLKRLEILRLAASDIKALPKEIAQLTQLRLLDLSGCRQLQIIPPKVLASLSKLEELYMDNGFDQWEDEANASLEELKHLSHLTTLYVRIPNARIIPKDLFTETLDRYRIFIGVGVKYWPNEYECSRSLKISRMYTSIYMDIGMKILLNKVDDLYLDQLKGVKNVLAELNDGKDFPHLKKLHIQNGMEVQYITSEKFDMLSKLRSLTLEDLPQLISFYSEETKCSTSQLDEGDMSSTLMPLFNKQFVFHHLESLKLSKINTQRIWHNKNIPETYFCVPNLTNLSIVGCGKLEHLFSPFIARSLVQLRILEIRECNCLTNVIFTDRTEEEINDAVCFPQLNSLVMKDLHNLIEFCSASYMIEFPLLKILEIERCLKLKAFINSEEKSQSGVRALFNDKVAVPCLERMTISGLKNVKMVFGKELQAGSFCKLQEMRVQDCEELLTIFSWNKRGAFQSLQQLEVRSCDSVETIFQVGAGLNLEEAHDTMNSQLRRLEINDLRKLEHVWDRDPEGKLTFQNLREVDIWGCRSLKNVFPTSIAQHLSLLQHLRLSRCGAVEEIVSAELGKVLPSCLQFQFPQLSSLELTSLKQFKCLYRGQHTIELPMLKKLEIDRPRSTTGQPLFLVQQALDHLEELRLQNSGDDIAIIHEGQFPVDLFGPVKVLKLLGSFRISSLLKRFPKMESLEIDGGDFFTDVDAAIEEPSATGMLSQIKKLTLSDCKNVEHIWKKLDWQLGSILSSLGILPASPSQWALETLEVKGCKDLINLGFSSSSFRNLTTLKVGCCEKMINLFPPSVIQNLEQLTTVSIVRCSAMTEIVANEEDTISVAANGEICFSNLKFLEFHDLQSLTSFCPAENYTFNFPHLQELIVNKCPRLEIFCQEVLRTPNLHRVKEFDYDRRGRWADDLNSTIKQLYAKKQASGKSNLKLSDTNTELMKMWNINPREILDFKNLQYMEVCNCSSLKYLFTPSIASSLWKLHTLQVKKCSTIEAVIMDDQEATRNDLILPSNLRSIEIESCSSLTSFYLGARVLEFPRLMKIRITDCPKMTTFAFSLGLDDRQLNAAPFFSEKVVCPKLGWLNLSSIKIQTIWHHQPLTSLHVHAEGLKFLKVEQCHNLKYLFPFFMIKHVVQLQSLHITDCELMEQVIFMQERISPPIPMLLPQLKLLSLKNLPRLSTFCSASATYFEFPCLTTLKLANCPSLETFISKFGDELQIHQNALFNEKVVVPSLKKLTIKGMSGCRKIWQDQLSEDSFSRLNYIMVKKCGLSNIFPFNMMDRLKDLGILQVVNCHSVQEIIAPQQLIANEAHIVQTVAKLFPRVTHLRLEDLPKLKSFYPGIHATEWPFLEKMEVIDCHQVQLFASKSASLGEISNQPPLFRVNEVTFPVLRKLRWKPNDQIFNGTSWCGQVLSTECSRKVKVVELMGVTETSIALPYFLIQSLPTLQKLVVDDAAFCQIFDQFEGPDAEETQALVLTQLTELRLSKLPELTHIWKNESQSSIAVLSNLRILQVQECGKLKTLVSPLVSFKNLTTLEVSRCHGIVKFIAWSTAKSLVLLERITITDCEMIEEITACGGAADEIQGGIVLSRLEHLELSCLPSLVSFCLRDHTFEFPALQRVIVKECPKMEIFCQGDLSTPKLKQVQLTGDGEGEGRWETDLKTTVKRLFEEMNVQNSEVTEATLQLE